MEWQFILYSEQSFITPQYDEQGRAFVEAKVQL